MYTDHAACTSLLKTARPSGKLARWALTIQEMDLTIRHRPGKKNTNADALSRNPAGQVGVVQASAEKAGNVSEVEGDGAELLSEEVKQNAETDGTLATTDPDNVEPTPGKLRAIRDLQLQDPKLMYRYLESGQLPGEQDSKRVVLESCHYDIIKGVLYYEPPTVPGQLCIVVPESLKRSILQEAHCTNLAGHFAFQKVYDRICRHYRWKGLRSDVHKFCRSCLVCSSRRGPGRPLCPPLTPIPVGGLFHRVGIDVLQLPVTRNGNRYVICFLDYLTKWVEAFPASNQQAETIALLFVDNVVCKHGVPDELLSDRGSNFLSELLQSVCDILDVKKINTSGYHPQTDGLVEKFNSTLISLISKCCEISDHDWDEHLQMLLFAYRSSVQVSTQESPFFLLYGRDPRLPTETTLSGAVSPYLVDISDYQTELVRRMSTAWSVAKEQIENAQQRQKKQYDRYAKDPKIQIGDRVMVHMPGELQVKEHKLVRPFHEPYRVLKATPNNVVVVLIYKPRDSSIFVALNRVRLCYPEQPEELGVGPGESQEKQEKGFEVQ